VPPRPGRGPDACFVVDRRPTDRPTWRDRRHSARLRRGGRVTARQHSAALRAERRSVSEERRRAVRVPGDTAGALRLALLALVFVSAGGLTLELLLLEHFDSPWQWAPFVLLGAVLVATAALMRAPSARLVRLYRALMALCVATGLLGVYLHYRGNVEFELEQEPLRRGIALFWEAIRGATPALAPAALSQLGLLGLACTFRHPALGHRPPARPSGPDGHSPPERP
jgi:hypothetical protein